MGNFAKRCRLDRNLLQSNKQITYLILICFCEGFVDYFLQFLQTNKNTHKHTKKALFQGKKNPFFPYSSKTSKKSWKSQSSWHELFVSYFPRDHQLLVAAVMCWGECTGGFRTITASRHSRFLPDRSVRGAQFSVDQVPWCTGAVRGAEPALQRLSSALWKLSVVLKASAWGSCQELSMVP